MFPSSIKKNENICWKVIHSKTVSWEFSLNETGPLSSRSSLCSREDQFHQQLFNIKGWKKSNGNAQKVGTNPKIPHLKKSNHKGGEKWYR